MARPRNSGVSSQIITLLVCGVLASLVPSAYAQAPDEPILRVDTNGPTSAVTALAFSPDGLSLYMGSMDKVVRVWQRAPGGQGFALRPQSTLRVPIGPGEEGLIYTIAVSPDGNSLAVAGRGAHRASPGFRQGGFLTPREAVSEEIRSDDGQIYVFDLATRLVHRVRGHLGPVLSMQIVGDENPRIYSVGIREIHDSQNDTWRATLRRFDLATGNQLGGKVLPDPQVRPGLAVLPMPIGGRGDDHAVVAWGDGNLRIWDTSKPRQRMQDVPDGDQFNSSAVVDEARQRVVTASYVGQPSNQSRIHVFNASADAPYLRPLPNGSKLLGRAGNTLYHPQALALVHVRPGAPATHVAALVQVINLPATTTGWELRLYEYNNAGIGRQVRRTPLPQFGQVTTAPALAAAADGRYLALASGSHDEALLFDVGDLITRPNTQATLLNSTAPTLSGASFVRNGESVGLFVEQASGRRFVFDAESRQVVDNLQGWQRQTPQQPSWQIQSTQNPASADDTASLTLTSSSANAQRITISLPAEHYITAAATVDVPPSENGGPGQPVAVVASVVSLSPILSVYDIATQQLLRRYSGHNGTIRSIEASSDGRLLITASDDHTVCVWDLSDLRGIGQQQGGIPGLVIDTQDNGQLAVTNVADMSPATGRLREGDVILSVRDAGSRVNAENRAALYEYVETHRAGDVITFQVQGRGDVAIRLAAVSDERKPLLTMFFDMLNGNQVDWAGWSPLGPFDSSSPEIEQKLGWHFNTPSEPRLVRFARLEEYTDDRNPGVIQQLLTDGKPPVAARLPLEAPVMRLSVVPAEDAGGGLLSTPLVRAATASAKLDVVGISPSDVRSVSVNRGGEPLGEMALAADGGWYLELPAQALARGYHDLRAFLTTDEREPQTFQQEMTFRYQPAAPQIRIVQAPPTDVAAQQVNVVAQVDPVQGQRCQVTLTHYHDGKLVRTSTRRWDVADAQMLQHTVTLSEGLNQISIYAVYDDALVGYERLEEARQDVIVRYAPKQELPPPVVSVAVVNPAAIEAVPPQQIAIGQRNAITYPNPQFVIELTGEQPLQNGKLVILDADAQQQASADVQLAKKGATATQNLPLNTPGNYTVSLVSQDGDKALEIFRGELVLTAPLPQIKLVQPAEDVQLIEDVDADGDEITLVAMLDRGDAEFPFTVAVMRNGRRIDDEVTVDRDRITATVRVEPGSNRLQFRVENDFDRSLTPPVVATLLQLPVVEQVNASPHEEAICDLVVRGKSAIPLIELKVDGISYPADVLNIQSVGRSYTATVQGLPLEEGRNEFAVVAVNRDGRSLDPGLAQVAYVPPRPATKAEIVIVNPTQPIALSRAEAELEFVVISESDLSSVEVFNENTRIFTATQGDTVTRDEQDHFVHAFKQTVPLFPGVNPLTIKATNAAGLSQQALPSLSFVQSPVRYEVTGLQATNERSGMLEPTLQTDGTSEFTGAIEDSLVFIHGKVTWTDKSKRPSGIMAIVNEFQWPADEFTQVEGENEATFRIPAVLNNKENNVTITSVFSKDSASKATVLISCEEPSNRNWLHLLIVGVGVDEANRDKLTKRALESLHATEVRKGEYRTKTFDQIFLYPPFPIGSSLSAKEIRTKLLEIDRVLQNRGRNQARACDVVMLYYEGGQIVKSGGGLGISTRPVEQPRVDQLAEHTLTIAFLEGFVKRLKGAQVFLLDLARPSELEQNAQLPEPRNNKTQTAVFRYVWTNQLPPRSDANTLISIFGRVAPVIRLDQLHEELTQVANSEDVLQYEGYVPIGMQTLQLGP